MSRSPEARRTVAYLGGRGSFSEQACQQFLPTCALMPFPDFASVARAVCQGSADVAVLPFRNSLAGPIEAVLALLGHPELRKVGEQELEVRLHLLAPRGTTIGAIREVTSHGAALRQCAAFLAKRQIAAVEAPSTAEAARQIANDADPARAAIASEIAADIYGLTILARNVQGEAASVTRFAIVERRDQFA